jgi:hypothetical protein
MKKNAVTGIQFIQFASSDVFVEMHISTPRKFLKNNNEVQ